MGFVELRQRTDYKNWSTFTGAGQDLSLSASLGTLSQYYGLSFTNPWIFDRPYSFGFDVYRKGHDDDEDSGYAYSEKTNGAVARFGHEFNEYISAGLAYRIERTTIDDILDTATSALRDYEGTTDLIGLSYSMGFDTRDNIRTPSRGIFLGNTFDWYGGFLGGDANFVKNYSTAAVYFPLVRKSVLEFKAGVGIAYPFDDTVDVPLFERFYAGGASTIRGYHERKVGPIDAVTEDPLAANRCSWSMPSTLIRFWILSRRLVFLMRVMCGVSAAICLLPSFIAAPDWG